MMSARAWGVYVYLRMTGAPISAESLSKEFKEGRDAMGSALKELKLLGAVTSKQERIGNRIMTINRLVEPDSWALETRPLLQQTEQNSNLILSTYSFISKKEYLGEPRGGTEMENYNLGQIDLDYDDINEQRRKEREKKHREYEEAKAAHFAEKAKAKSEKLPADWTTDDSVYEFAQRLDRYWHIKPWTQARTRFKGAFGQARKTHGTDGELEIKMMDRFFSGLEHNKTIDDPERIWKLFIRDFASLLLDVQRSTVTPEDIAAAKAIADKQWED